MKTSNGWIKTIAVFSTMMLILLLTNGAQQAKNNHVDPTGAVTVGSATYPVNMPFCDAVELGLVPGASIMKAMGERESMGTTATGEDIWRGVATSIPHPPDIGEQMSIVSTSPLDGIAGTGVLTIRIHYLDATGNEQTEDITMTGLVAVSTVATDIRFVNDMYSLTKGSGGVAAGDITIADKGTGILIYNLVATGGNKSLVPNRMVPLGKTLILKHWRAQEAQNKRVNVRIRSTDMNGVLILDTYEFKSTAYLNQTSTGDLPMCVEIPALSKIKVSGWPDALGAEVGCDWWGFLYDD